MDILTAENLSSIEVANRDLIYWSVRSSSRRGGDGIKGVIIILASCKYHFIKVHENLVQHLSYHYIELWARKDPFQ